MLPFLVHNVAFEADAVTQTRRFAAFVALGVAQRRAQ
jgi:hypothetical protein